MISKIQMQILRDLCIMGLFILTNPDNAFQMLLGFFLFIGAMFLNYDYFAKEQQGEQDDRN